MHYNYGISLLEIGKSPEAIREFRIAVKLNPNYGLAHCALGKALQRIGESEEGTSELQRAQELGVCRPVHAGKQ